MPGMHVEMQSVRCCNLLTTASSLPVSILSHWRLAGPAGVNWNLLGSRTVSRAIQVHVGFLEILKRRRESGVFSFSVFRFFRKILGNGHSFFKAKN